MRLPRKYFFFAVTLILLLAQTAKAEVLPFHYGIYNYDRAALNTSFLQMRDSFFHAQPQLGSTHVIMNIEPLHPVQDKTTDFYLLLFMCLILGLIRYSDRRYFQNLWRAFWNPTLSSRQLRDQLESSSLSNLLTNLFFAISAGTYIYYVGTILSPQRSGGISPSLLILMLIAGVVVIYLVKFAVVRFSGWALRLEGVTDQYLFNVFLINKIIGITLTPFVILLAFAGPELREPVIIVSLVLVGLLLLNRYTRSWQVFGSFFQYSKFHFFTYLCASELLPLALLMKLLVRGL